MPDFLFLMHDDAPDQTGGDAHADWRSYLNQLRDSGRFQGGSAIGTGSCIRKSGDVPEITGHLTGFIRVQADCPEHAKALLAGNPVFEAGGTVEIRELPRTD